MNPGDFRIPLDDYEQEELDETGDVWRLCPSYPGYDASWNGWVRSWLVPNHTVHGYYYEVFRVPVRSGDKVTERTRGHMVANAFLIQPEPAWQLQYLDGNNKNPAAQNLTWQIRMDRINRPVEGERLMRPRKTHCIHGHPLTDDNVYLTKGERHCVVCVRAHSSMHARRRRLKNKGLDWSHVTLEFVLKERGAWIDPATRT